jgi:Flp pilus assembly protein TadG
MSNTIATFANKLKKSSCNAFYKDNGGNFAVIFALTTLPVLMSVGLGIDYSRSADARAAMQAAADSAVISLVLDNTSDKCVVKKQRAINSVKGSMKSKDWINYTDAGIVVTDEAGGGCTVAISGQINTAIMAIAGFATMDVAVTATAISAPSKKIEIALALDNTASMGDQGMADLRLAANKFVDTMSAKTPSTHLKMGIVPFVAMVNPGYSYLENDLISDYDAKADYHGYYLAGQNLEQAYQCGSEAWVGVGTGGAPKEQTWINDVFSGFGAQFAAASQELLGINLASAARKKGKNKTAATDLATIKSTWVKYDFIVPNTEALATVPPDPDKNKVATIFLPEMQKNLILNNKPQSDLEFTFPAPTRSGNGNYCVPKNPIYISHFDLFDRTGPNGVPWKGCVMARKASNDPNTPSDVNDLSPTADPNTKFVPMFWPTEPASDKNMAYSGVYSDPLNKIYNNVYLAPTFSLTYADNTFKNIGLFGGDYIFSYADLMRYNKSLNGMVSMPIIENDVDTLGPNKGCPNAVTPLTNSTTDVKAAIADLTRWNGGGTVTSEGLMWAWRVLSPNKPYALGATYTDTSVQKYIILMSDGANYLNETGPQNVYASDGAGNTYRAPPPVGSEHTAYGAIHEGNKTFAPQVVGINPSASSAIYTKADADALLDERFALACTNAKAQGIKVYTIFFSHGVSDPRAEKSLSDCSGVNHINANDANALDAAFKKIAASIYSTPRLSK